jgi:hypothetical protein
VAEFGDLGACERIHGNADALRGRGRGNSTRLFQGLFQGFDVIAKSAIFAGFVYDGGVRIPKRRKRRVVVCGLPVNRRPSGKGGACGHCNAALGPVSDMNNGRV